MISLTELLLFASTFLISVAIIDIKLTSKISMVVINRERNINKKRKDNRRRYPFRSSPSLPVLGSLQYLNRGLKKMPEYFMNKAYELNSMFSFKMSSRVAELLNLNESKVLKEVMWHRRLHRRVKIQFSLSMNPHLDTISEEEVFVQDQSVL